jgi:hypothetical protein
MDRTHESRAFCEERAVQHQSFRYNTAVPLTKARDQAIEALRIVAAYGIVAFHCGAPLRSIGYAGLIVFILLATLLDVKFNWRRKRSPAELAVRLLVPWLFWFAFYGAINGLRGRPVLIDMNAIPGILYGPSPHLWYLPFIFCVLVALNSVKGRISPERLFWVSLLIAATLLVTAHFWRPISALWVPPMPQWMHAAPIVFVGVAMGLAERVRYGRASAIVVLTISLMAAARPFLPGISDTYTIGIVLVVAVAWLGPQVMPSNWNVSALSSCMMGVYLTHIFWLDADLLFFGERNYVSATIIFFVSLGTVWAARRFFPLSRIVLT